MSASLFRGSLIASMVLMITVQFLTSESHAKTSFLSRDVISERFTPTVSRPVAGRNRRNIALSTSTNRYPRALNDQIVVPSHTNKLRINVLANDTGNRLKIKEVNNRSARGGRVYFSGHHVVYLPKPSFRGWDSFWYAVVDAQGRRHSAKVNICLCDK